MIGVGVVTYNRSSNFRKCVKALLAHAPEGVQVYAYDDGSDPMELRQVEKTVARYNGQIRFSHGTNRGVSHAKNQLLERMLADGCDWLFTLEDDILLRSPEAILGYVAACERSGYQHLSFAHHGPGNQGEPAAFLQVPDGNPTGALRIIDFWPHAIGAWCVYGREALLKVGLMDPHFVNAWEHVEHSLRLAQAGFTSAPPTGFADVHHSERLLVEIPGSIQRSSISKRTDHVRNIVTGAHYWHDTMPDTWEILFGVGRPLHDYGLNVLSCPV